jgi:hypothetical protein
MWCLASRPCWLFTNDSLRLPSHSWPCLGAHQLSHRSTLSRFLAALDQASVEALRSLFQEDLLARKPFAFPGGLFAPSRRAVGSRRCRRNQGYRPKTWHCRRRTPCLLPIGDLIRYVRRAIKDAKCGEIVRTRTVLLQAHTHQFFGTFGGSGNGDYRGELRRAIAVMTSYAAKLGLPPAHVLRASRRIIWRRSTPH